MIMTTFPAPPGSSRTGSIVLFISNTISGLLPTINESLKFKGRPNVRKRMLRQCCLQTNQKKRKLKKTLRYVNLKRSRRDHTRIFMKSSDTPNVRLNRKHSSR